MVFVFIFLPVFIAAPIQLIRGLPLTDIHVAYGAAWYCIPGFIVIVASGGLAKYMMYGMPMYYEILPNGKAKRRKLPLQKRPSLKDYIAKIKLSRGSKEGCLAIGLIVFLLLGSALAMIF